MITVEIWDLVTEKNLKFGLGFCEISSSSPELRILGLMKSADFEVVMSDSVCFVQRLLELTCTKDLV